MTRISLTISLTIVATIALAACAPMPPTQSGDSLPPMTCNADPAAWAAGKQATAEIVEHVRIDTHGRVVRLLRPGQMITMEFSAERVDIRVDGDNVILAITCG